MNPRVSVLLPVRNGARFIREAVESILAQTFPDFEFIILDDGSTDATPQIIAGYHDPRIRVTRTENSRRIAWTLNRGIQLARGDYIARMDADDISAPARFQRQVEFLDAHPNVGACGTWAHQMDESGTVTGLIRSPAGKAMESNVWRPSPIIHPSAMIRRSLPDLHYEDSLIPAEDYDLWLRLRRSCTLSNLPEALLYYRIHHESATGSRRDKQLRLSYEVFCRHFRPGPIPYEVFLGLILAPETLNPATHFRAHRHLARELQISYTAFLREDFRHARRWIKRALRGQSTNATPHPEEAQTGSAHPPSSKPF